MRAEGIFNVMFKVLFNAIQPMPNQASGTCGIAYASSISVIGLSLPKDLPKDD
jgi:hypothetical protein